MNKPSRCPMDSKAKKENSKDRQARELSVLNVVKVVNYALALEHLESAFYRKVREILPADVDYSDLTAENGEMFNAAIVRARFEQIGAHEDEHVVTLTNVVRSLCGLVSSPNCAPVAACTYNFGLTEASSINDVVASAELLENTGVKAYVGAIASLIQPTVLSADGSTDSAMIVEAAASIATVEARHAAFLSTIRGLNPFPQAQDTPETPKNILCTAQAFVVNPTTCAVFRDAMC